MRWFKHFTDNHRGRSINFLMDELGHMGPCCYWILMEMCAEKLERKLDVEVSQDDCEFTFHRRVVESALRIKRLAVHRLLSAGSTTNLFQYEINGEFIKIKMPILLDLLDYDSKKSRPRRASVTPESRLDTETESDHIHNITEPKEETQSSENIFDSGQNRAKPKKKSTASADHKASALVAHYCDEFKFRYKVNPSISKADSGILKKLFHEMGIERAKDLIRAYFEMPEPYVIKSKHPIKLLSYKINEVLVYAETGAFVTNSQVRQAEKAQASNDLMRKIESGNI